jgi:adenine-specific DNA-methyltransferase
MPENNFRKIELIYKGKEDKKNILINTKSVKLKKLKTFDKNGNEWSNMLIFGDNLHVLKTLIENQDIKDKVKLIYIDPPFSTNHEFKGGKLRTSTISSSEDDETAYEDKLIGAEYLEFLRKRLILLKELLANDGSIYVHIDYKIGHYVKILMDEVFGKENSINENFINEITRIKSNPKNFSRNAYGNIKDMILFYSKTKEFIWNNPTKQFSQEDIERLFPKIDKDGRSYTTNPLHAPGETKNGKTGQMWKDMKPPTGRHWRYPPEELEKLDKEGLIEWSSRGVPRKKIYADEFIKKGMKIQDIWEFKDPQYPSYPTEKNLDMLKLIAKASSNPNDIVLDAFCGSGTTLVAAEELGRKWIGIDNSPLAIKETVKKLLNLKNSKTFSLYGIEDQSLPIIFNEFLQ